MLRYKQMNSYLFSDNLWFTKIAKNIHGFTCMKLFVSEKVTSTSSSRSDSVSLWHAQSRAVVFHTLNRVQRDNRLCSLIKSNYLRVLTTVAPYQESSFTSPLSLFSPTPFCRRRCCFPLPRQIRSCLFPPPHLYSHPR